MTKTKSTFASFARNVARNASTYKTIKACELVHARIQKRFIRAGSYGCDDADRMSAIRAIQDRVVELQCQAAEAAYAAAA